MSDALKDRVVEKVDLERRAALRKLIAGAYSAPVLATFAMAGLARSEVAMAESNLATVPTLTDWTMPAFGVALGAAALVTLAAKKSDEKA
jgi:hypothetical protein